MVCANYWYLLVLLDIIFIDWFLYYAPHISKNVPCNSPSCGCSNDWSPGEDDSEVDCENNMDVEKLTTSVSKRLSLGGNNTSRRPPIYPTDDDSDDDSLLNGDDWGTWNSGKRNQQQTREKENAAPSFLARIERPVKNISNIFNNDEDEEDDLRYSRHSSSKSLLSTDDLRSSRHSSASLQMLNISLDDESDLDSSMELSSEDAPPRINKREPLQEVIDLCDSPF